MHGYADRPLRPPLFDLTVLVSRQTAAAVVFAIVVALITRAATGLQLDGSRAGGADGYAGTSWHGRLSRVAPPL